MKGKINDLLLSGSITSENVKPDNLGDIRKRGGAT
jgi:hypothetical protein